MIREAEQRRLRQAIDAALHELGEPGPDYPAPVANAVAILRAAVLDPETHALTLLNAAEEAWGIIANAFEGDWERAPAEWRSAAEQWRDTYMPLVARLIAEEATR